MKPVPSVLTEYLKEQHVMSVAGHDEEGGWAANCYYVWQEKTASFIILTALKTRHGMIMQHVPQVYGTVADNEASVASLRGIQYTAEPILLSGNMEKQARSLFYHKFPIARVKPSPIWQLKASFIKMTNNRLGFGHKTLWQRD